jgi:uncharacterized protein with HEPN domain
MSRDPAYLLDILIAARLIREYVSEVDRAEFDSNVMMQDAVMRRIGIIGEAARRVSDEFRQNHPEIPWSGMIGMRNVLVHDYDKVKLDDLWRTIENNIPSLIAQIEPLVPPDEDEDTDHPADV